MVEAALAKTRESQVNNTTVISALDESQRSKSALMMLPSEQSVSKAPPEIEDIIREAQKEEAKTGPVEEAKKK